MPSLALRIFAALLLLGAIAAPARAGEDAVARGAYLAKLGDCAACHTPQDGKPFAGGFPVNSPFGIIYATNITPDRAHGIGGYSEEDFARALRRGVAKDGHHIYPAMPYASFAGMSDGDVADLYAYFMQGVAPSDYAPPPTKLPFPFNQRWGLAFWNLFFARHDPFTPSAGHDAQWNRGAYLTQTLGHCGACHTPRDPLYKEEGYDEGSSAYLSGMTLDRWHAADLRGDAGSGLGRWSADDIAAFLKTGRARGAVVFGAMQDVVTKSGQYMTDDDARAIGVYLKSLPARGVGGSYDPGAPQAGRQVTMLTTAPRQLPGAGTYMQYCARCHGADGSGTDDVPALAGNPEALSDDPASLIHIVLKGGQPPAAGVEKAGTMMPAFERQMNDRQIADTISYLRASWGNDAPPVTLQKVAAIRRSLHKNPSVADPPASRAAAP